MIKGLILNFNYVDEDTKIKEARIEADNGSEKHQAILGQYYYKKAEAGVQPEENGKLAVDWLVKASKQGSDEATALLSECLANDIGRYFFRGNLLLQI